MNTIEVLAPGMLTTVQDLGRQGFGVMGVSPSGAADAVALRLGNRLVGNAEGMAGLEMTLLGGTFLFQHRAVIAIAGSDFGATLEDASVGPWTSVEVQAGKTLRIGPTRTGARCYLCVQGGIVVENFLGSASTHLLSRLGGFEGRALRKGDVLRRGATGAFRKLAVSREALQFLGPRKVLRVTMGPQWDWFPDASRQLFLNGTHKVAEESNRMGLRLDGPKLEDPTVNGPAVGGPESRPEGEMLSEGVALGAIQIPESGNPIVLFVEQQTTGGYPKIANVISADMNSVGQLRPRDEIRFELIEMELARALYVEQETLLASADVLV